MTIVGTATLPAVGGAGNFTDHASIGMRTVFSDHVSPAFLKGAQGPDPTLNGPGMVSYGSTTASAPRPDWRT